MSDNIKTYLVTDLMIEIDHDALADHDEQTSPPRRLSEWYGGDLEAALDAGIATVVHAEITLTEEATDES